MLIIATAAVGAMMFASNALAAPNEVKAPAAKADGSTSPIIEVESSSVGSFKFTLKGEILEDVRIPGTRLSSRLKGRFSGWNSLRRVNGQLVWFWDTNMIVCRNRNSPTGLVKCGGGRTGRNCSNPVKLHGPPPGPIVRVFTNVRMFQNIHIVVKAQASAKVSGRCPNVDLSGEASASGTVRMVIDKKIVAQARGRASRIKVLVKEKLKALGVAKAVARLKLNCGPGAPPPAGKAPVIVVKNCVQDGNSVSCPGTFGFTVNGAGREIGGGSTRVDDFQIGTSVTVCETDPRGWSADKGCETQTVGSGGATFSFVNRKVTSQPPPPPTQKGRAVVVKNCVQDGNSVSCPGTFGFTVNGAGREIGGGSTDVGEFNVGTSVTVCETDPRGWDGGGCQTQTAIAGTITFTFTNRKVTPPPPPGPTVTINVPAHICPGGQYTVFASTTGNIVGYSWSSSGNVTHTDGASSSVLTGVDPGPAWVQVTVTDDRGRTATARGEFRVATTQECGG
jgi:hypothetical protein